MKNDPRHKIWMTFNGRDLQIRQMETSHIKRCIDLIYFRTMRGAPWRVGYVTAFYKELLARGEWYVSRFHPAHSSLVQRVLRISP